MARLRHAWVLGTGAQARSNEPKGSAGGAAVNPSDFEYPLDEKDREPLQKAWDDVYPQVAAPGRDGTHA